MSFVSTFALLFQGVRLASLDLLLSLSIHLYVDCVMTAVFQPNSTAGTVEFLITPCGMFYAISESTLQSLTEPLRVLY